MSPIASDPIDLVELQGLMARHLPHYRNRKPHYQAEMLASLMELGLDKATRLLDVGGGTGIIAEVMQHLLPQATVVAIDVVDRFCSGLTVETRAYDGRAIPFGGGEFDCATLNNVLHHVPVDQRVSLLKEIRRVVAGPLLIKDHASQSRIGDVKLTMLDAIGNIPFGGMIKASYLSAQDWQDLADASGYTIAARAEPRGYRSGIMAAIFPNQLEITLRLEPL